MMLMWILVVTTLLVSDVAVSIPIQQNGNDPVDMKQRWTPYYVLNQGHCDENWFYFSDLNSCFRYYHYLMTWNEAEKFCNRYSHYGNLATVTSNRHNKFISKVISYVDENTPGTWIGLNDIWKEGNFTWSDGTIYSYSNWADSEPNDQHFYEDCVQIHFFSDSEKWNDYDCDESHGFVCSYKLQ
ncbi:C-type lectin mannose-binding isoform-like [Hypanus sabinus]|uniref:C-type lectin mannose-binding isoform-like n=1 Tax=Hypanus sabinus TaxID=79690 RepID=UPI0028C3D76E|nr:C-type lectin mannose-binding isoform-like [Hypanus sabinus]XP_059842826.1 C-type lectin mannose-binding isoform-like [Hypanus sabinus]